MTQHRRLLARLAPLGLLLAACTKGPAFGSDNAIIVALAPDLETALREPIRESLERTVFTTRDEPVFEITFTTPESIGEFRKWRRIVVIEPLDGAVLLPELADLPSEGSVDRVITDKWARNQTIHALGGADRAATVALVETRIDDLYEALHAAFVEHHVARMWASGRDSSLARQIEADLGFSLVLPRVYRPAQASAPAATRTWFNLEPRRIVSLHWTPVPAALDADTLFRIRADWGAELFPGDSISIPGTQAVTRTELGGAPALRIQGRWDNQTDVTGGVFLTYGVVCGDRLVLVDGNLYAPDRPKYPYLLQLEQIFATFRCGGETP